MEWSVRMFYSVTTGSSRRCSSVMFSVFFFFSLLFFLSFCLALRFSSSFTSIRMRKRTTFINQMFPFRRDRRLYHYCCCFQHAYINIRQNNGGNGNEYVEPSNSLMEPFLFSFIVCLLSKPVYRCIWYFATN